MSDTSSYEDSLFTLDVRIGDDLLTNIWDIESTQIISNNINEFITPEISDISNYITIKLLNSDRGVNYESLLDRVVSKIVQLTGSTIGTISFQSDSDKEVECISFGEDCPGTISINLMNTEKKSKDGLFANIIQRKEAVIINNRSYFDIPSNHHKVNNLLVIPMNSNYIEDCVRNKNTKGCNSLLAIGNKKDGYSIDIIKKLLPLTHILCKILVKNNTTANNHINQINNTSAADKIKDQFWATMSHELRTPLNGILPLISLFPETGPLNEKQVEYLDRLTDCTLQLSNLLNNILDFSKISAKRLALNNIPFSVYDSINNARNIVEPAALTKNLKFVVDIPENIPMMIGDSQRLTQILINLLSNAVKFTDTGFVALQLKIKKISDSFSFNSPELCRSRKRNSDLNKDEFSYKLASGWSEEWNSSDEDDKNINNKSSIGGEWVCQFEISDSGIGIRKEEQDEIFDVFHQSNYLSPYLSKSGTGLGLSISKELINLMKGNISVKSEGISGRGSKFMFYVKMHEEIDIPSIKDQHPELFNGTRVLIVDDRAEMRLQITDIVFKWGCEPITVSSAEEALQFIKNGVQFKIALIDICMPYMSGVELAQELRRITPNMPLIGISSIELDDITGEKYFDMYMYKPVDQNRLFAAVYKCLKTSNNHKKTSKATLHQNLLREKSTKERMCILIAEDNSNNAYTIKEMLLSLGYSKENIDLVENGGECVRASRFKRYDVILMDIIMPGMDGIEASKYIRQTNNPPMIIAVSASVQSSDKTRCQRVGIDGYLEKPFTIGKLDAALSPLLI